MHDQVQDRTQDRPSAETALSRLDDLDALPAAEHGAVYEELYRELQDALAVVDPA